VAEAHDAERESHRALFELFRALIHGTAEVQPSCRFKSSMNLQSAIRN
jgi:hypothetical protein